jgi:hypothetical protein
LIQMNPRTFGLMIMNLPVFRSLARKLWPRSNERPQAKAAIIVLIAALTTPV